MHAIVCSEFAPIDRLAYRRLPAPQMGPGQVRIAVHAAGVNFPDALIVQGLYQSRPELPFIPGNEISGVVVEVGHGVDALRVGTRVIAMTPQGGYADEAVVDADRVLPMPEAMSFEEGAAFTLVYGTSLYALAQRGGVMAGETVLVLGAAGGVGLAAVEIARAMGARVIAAASTPEKLALAQAHGAHEGIDYTKERLRDGVKRLTGGRGADVVCDPVGGDAFDEAMRSVAWLGRVLVIGFASGRIPNLPVNLTLLKNCDVRGVFYGAWRNRAPAEGAANVERLLGWYRDGLIKPHVSERVPLERAVDAMRALTERRVTGKIVLITGR